MADGKCAGTLPPSAGPDEDEEDPDRSLYLGTTSGKETRLQTLRRADLLRVRSRHMGNRHKEA